MRNQERCAIGLHTGSAVGQILRRVGFGKRRSSGRPKLHRELAKSRGKLSRDRAVVFRGKVSSSGNIDIRVSTSSVAITQSIGLEWQFRVGQIKRNGPVPRVPPTTRNRVLQWSDHRQGSNACRRASAISGSDRVAAGFPISPCRRVRWERAVASRWRIADERTATQSVERHIQL